MAAVEIGAKQTRRRADRDFKRTRILEAARAVLLRKGLAATMRDIAAEAGYTPGALYAYYPGRDDLLADIAAQILGEAGRTVRQEVDRATGPAATIRTALHVLHRHLSARDQDRTLLITVLTGTSPLTGDGENETDRQVTGRVITLMRPVVGALEDAGLTQGQAAVEALALLTQVVGLLVMEGHGRLQRLGFTPQRVLDRQADHLIQRLGA